MRFLGLTPKILATSVALHTSLLATVGYFKPEERRQGNPSKSGYVGLRFSHSGGPQSAGLQSTKLKSKLLASAASQRPRRSASLKNVRPISSAQSDVATSGPQAAGNPLYEGASPESMSSQGDGFEPTLGLKLVTSSIVMPPYTDDARIKRFEGTLTVEVVTDPDGRVTDARLTNPSGLDLDAGVLAAARMAVYEPPTDSDGSKIVGRARLRFRFHLEPETL